MLTGCDNSVPEPAEAPDTPAVVSQGPGLDPGPYNFSASVFGIDATSNGSILVAETPPVGSDQSTTTIKEIRKQGVQDVTEFSHVQGVPINGLAVQGRGNIFAAHGGGDLAVGAGLWHVSPGNAQEVADIEAYETENDPDKFAIETEGGADSWKDPACAPASGPFTPGPQSNPYHLTRLSGSTALIADAAGNAVLRAKQNGDVSLVALLTPPTDGNGEFLEFPFEGAMDGDCYRQPVPTSPAIGPNDYIYVGELTGFGPGGTGVSRVWQIEPGAEGVTCPSSACEVAMEGFTAIIDLAFGPDGDLFVVEFDENGPAAAFPGTEPAGGTVNRCDLDTGTCEVVEGDLTFPGDITFDKWGQLWLLEDPQSNPTVRQLDLP